MQTRWNHTDRHQQHVSIQPADSYHDSVLCPLPHLTFSAASCKHLVQKNRIKKVTTADRQYLTTSSCITRILTSSSGIKHHPSLGADELLEQLHILKRVIDHVNKLCVFMKESIRIHAVWSTYDERKLWESYRMSFAPWLNPPNLVPFFIYLTMVWFYNSLLNEL